MIMLLEVMNGGRWEVFLRGLPRLERIGYQYNHAPWADVDGVDPFVLALSQPFEGESVCPELQCLELPRWTLDRHPSVALLKRALKEREGCGKRVKKIQLDGGARSEDGLMLELFRDVDKVFLTGSIGQQRGLWSYICGKFYELLYSRSTGFPRRVGTEYDTTYISSVSPAKEFSALNSQI